MADTDDDLDGTKCMAQWAIEHGFFEDEDVLDYLIQWADDHGYFSDGLTPEQMLTTEEIRSLDEIESANADWINK
jgi:hypothetical protein